MSKKSPKSAAAQTSQSSVSLPSLSVKVRLGGSEGEKASSLLAYADLTIAGAFVIRGIRVLRKSEGEGAFIAFPASRGKAEAADKWFDVAHPGTTEARSLAVGVVLGAYEAARRAESATA